MTTTANMTHSPLPWSYTPHVCVFDVSDANNHYISIGATEQDAQLICTAANSHQALVEALEAVLSDEGALCWRTHEWAKRRLETINEIAQQALDQLKPTTA